MNVVLPIGCRDGIFTRAATSGRRDGAAVKGRSRALAMVLAISLFTVVPALCHGQSPGGSGGSEPKTEHYAKILRAQAVLIELPQMFRANAELEAMRSGYETALVAAMVDLDPQTEPRLARISELQNQAMAGDGDGQSTLGEGRALRDALLATAARARRTPSVAAVAEPLVTALKSSVQSLENIDDDTRNLVTEGDLLIDVITMMSLLSR